jgi:hypothetical protein
MMKQLFDKKFEFIYNNYFYVFDYIRLMNFLLYTQRIFDEWKNSFGSAKFLTFSS